MALNLPGVGKLKEKASSLFGGNKGSLGAEEKEKFHKDLVRLSTQFKLTTNILQDNAQLLMEVDQSNNNEELQKMLKDVLSENLKRTQDKILNRENISQKEATHLVETLEKTTETLKGVGVTLDVNLGTLTDGVGSLVTDSRIDIQSRRKIFDEFKSFAEESKVSSSAFEELKEINSQNLNFTVRETDMIQSLVEQIKTDTKDTKVQSTLNELNNNMESSVLTQEELQDTLNQQTSTFEKFGDKLKKFPGMFASGAGGVISGGITAYLQSKGFTGIANLLQSTGAIDKATGIVGAGISTAATFATGALGLKGVKSILGKGKGKDALDAVKGGPDITKGKPNVGKGLAPSGGSKIKPKGGLLKRAGKGVATVGKVAGKGVGGLALRGIGAVGGLAGIGTAGAVLGTAGAAVGAGFLLQKGVRSGLKLAGIDLDKRRERKDQERIKEKHGQAATIKERDAQILKEFGQERLDKVRKNRLENKQRREKVELEAKTSTSSILSKMDVNEGLPLDDKKVELSVDKSTSQIKTQPRFEAKPQETIDTTTVGDLDIIKEKGRVLAEQSAANSGSSVVPVPVPVAGSSNASIERKLHIDDMNLALVNSIMYD